MKTRGRAQEKRRHGALKPCKQSWVGQLRLKMATKVGLLDHHQPITDSPAENIKRSRADLLVRRLLAEKLGPYLYRRLEVREQSIPDVRRFQTYRPSLPEGFPSHKAPSTVTTGPVAEQIPNCRACIVAANRIGQAGIRL